MSNKPVSSLARYDVIADRIRQSRQADSRGVLVVEGSSDKQLITRLTGKQWAIFPAGTRNLVPATVRGAMALAVTRIAGLVDRDFDDYFDEIQTSGDPIYSYAEADIEAVLVRGPWFEFMVEELGSEQKISNAGGPSSLRPIVVGIAGVMGVVRRANAQLSWGIDFDDLKFATKVNQQNLILAVPNLCAAIEGHLPNHEAKAHLRKLLKDIDARADHGPGSFKGHDAMEVVKVALRRIYGTTSAIDRPFISAALRLAADGGLLDVEPFPTITDCLSESP
jgi:hypothetical protein